MKKSTLLAPLALGLGLASSGFAEVKTINFNIANQSGQPYELSMSSVIKYNDKESAGCKVKDKDQVIMCRTNKDGKFDTSVVATFVFTKLGEGPTLIINEEGFTVRNNGENLENLAKIQAKMDAEGKWNDKDKTVTITFPKS